MTASALRTTSSCCGATTEILPPPWVKQDRAHSGIARHSDHTMTTCEQIIEHVLTEITRRTEDNNSGLRRDWIHAVTNASNRPASVRNLLPSSSCETSACDEGFTIASFSKR